VRRRGDETDVKASATRLRKKPLAENVDRGKMMNALFTALPNEALAYMREHKVPKNLESLMWHMELLYGM